MTTHPYLPEISSVSALKVPCPGKHLSLRQTEMVVRSSSECDPFTQFQKHFTGLLVCTGDKAIRFCQDCWFHEMSPGFSEGPFSFK